MIVFNVCILNNKQILIIKTLSKSNYTFVYSSYVLLILFILIYPLNPTEPPSFFVILSIRHNPSPLFYPLNPSQPPFILRYPINPSQPPFILSFQSALLLAPVSSFYHFNPYFSYKYHAFFILLILLTPSPLYSFYHVYPPYYQHLFYPMNPSQPPFLLLYSLNPSQDQFLFYSSNPSYSQHTFILIFYTFPPSYSQPRFFIPSILHPPSPRLNSLFAPFKPSYSQHQFHIFTCLIHSTQHEFFLSF